MPRVLLTNDDGVAHRGLQELRASLIHAGVDVTTIAPAENQSGVSRAVTVRGEVEVRELEPGSNPVYSCTGTPVDCVRIGLLARFVPDATVVVSGINHGVNLGDDTTYSGTVGAAIEAALLGSCGIAFSQQGDDHDVGLVERGSHNFGLAPVAAAIAARVAERPHAGGMVLNVNLPSRLNPTAPLQLTRLGRRFYETGWLQPTVTGDGPGTQRFQPYSGLTERSPEHETAPDVDFTAVLRGRISITPMPVRRHLAHPSVDDEWLGDVDMASVVAEAVARLTPSSVIRYPTAR